MATHSSVLAWRIPGTGAQCSHKFKDEILDVNEICEFFFLGTAPSHAAGPLEEHKFSLLYSFTMGSSCEPQNREKD